MEKIKVGILLTPPAELNFDIIREFYANAISIEDVCYSYCSFVRGRVVSFDRNSVISNEIREIAISGYSHGNKAPMTLGFPDLITGFYRKVGVDIPNVATKRISNIVNKDYLLRHCVPKLAGEAASQTQVHAPPTGLARYNEQKSCVYNW
ncbi:hypothetical protein RYX36_003135 [Vicia faba]